MTNYNERLDEILRTLFEDGTNAYFRHGGLGSFSDYENKKNNDVAEAKAKLQQLMVESRLDEVERADCQYNDGAIPLYQYFSERTDKLEKELEDDQL